MPSSSTHSREKRERNRESSRRGSRLARLQTQLEAVDEGEPQSPSPRSELLSPSSTDRRHRSESGHGSSSRRRHGGRSSSERHSSSHRHRDLDRSDASHRELLKLVMEQESEAEKLRKTLYSTLQRLEEEAQKAAELERNSRESAERFQQLNESRLQAQKEASKTSQELRLYQFQLQNAQAQIEEAQESVRQLEKQKEEAELSAARARAKARKLYQRQLVWQAREEGRRQGFEAGLREAQEQYLIEMPPPSTQRGSRNTKSSSRNRRRRGPTPPPDSETEVEQENRDNGRDDFEEEDTIPTEIALQSPDPFTARKPSRNIGIPSRFQEPNHQPPPEPEPEHPPVSHPPRAPSPNPTIPISHYAIDIPPHDEIVKGNRKEWVTAQKHMEINGAPSPARPVSQQPHLPPAEPVPLEQVTGPVYFVIPDAATPQSGPPPPAPVFPPSAFKKHDTPPKSAGATSIKKPRFLSLSKTKAQAASWYRSLSLRKKSKPEIDPDEDPHQPQQQQQQPAEQAPGMSNPTASGTENGDVYRYQPEAPTSWYTKPKSTKSRHSRIASAFDGGDNRLSRASTRLSDLDMVSAAPGRYQGEGSISGRSASRQLAQKLSIIKEDPLSRGNTPQVDRHPQPHAAGATSTMPAPLFAHSGQSEAGSARTGKRRPPEIALQNPNGLQHPSVQAHWGQVPPPMPVQSHSTGRSDTIQIDVQPATAAPEPSARPRPMDNNHLSPNYVYQPLRTPPITHRREPNYASSTTSKRSYKSGHQVTQSYSEPPARPADARSVRSSHSRSASAMGPVTYPSDLLAPDGGPPKMASRPASTSSFNPRDATSGTTEYLDAQPKVIYRSASRSSMHSRYDPDTYLDPAYFNAPDGQPAPQTLSPNMNINRQRSPSPGLEYV